MAEYGPETREQVIILLRRGMGLASICSIDDMPSRETVRLWQKADPEFDLAVTCAREDGFEQRADKAVSDAKSATDASLGRLALDAERWYLGKLSNAFSDNKKQELEHTGRVVTEIEFRIVDSPSC